MTDEEIKSKLKTITKDCKNCENFKPMPRVCKCFDCDENYSEWEIANWLICKWKKEGERK